jgi:hypothetical protein
VASVSDTFDRADSATTLNPPSDGGPSWSVLTGFGSVGGISSNRAYNPSGGQCRYARDTGTADVEVQGTVAVVGTDCGLVARATDDDNCLVLSLFFGSQPFLVRRQSGSDTTIAGPTGSAGAGDVLKISCNGSSITCYQNAAVLFGGAVTETFNQTATKHGMYLRDTSARMDDHSVTDLGGAAGHPAVRRLGGVLGGRPVEIGREGVQVYRAFPADLRRWGLRA